MKPERRTQKSEAEEVPFVPGPLLASVQAWGVWAHLHGWFGLFGR